MLRYIKRIVTVQMTRDKIVAGEEREEDVKGIQVFQEK